MRIRKSKCPSIDFEEERSFVREHKLVNMRDNNELQLKITPLKGLHEVLQGWNNYDNFYKLYFLEDYDTFETSEWNKYSKILETFMADTANTLHNIYSMVPSHLVWREHHKSFRMTNENKSEG